MTAKKAAFQHFIKLEKVGRFYTYDAVKYDPLTVPEACECLGDLVDEDKSELRVPVMKGQRSVQYSIFF